MTHAEARKLANWLNAAPKSIKVGPFTYTLTLSKEAREKGDMVLCGNYQSFEFNINLYVPNIQTTAFAAEVMLHELTHCIWDYTKLPSKAQEEPAVTQIARCMAGIMKDNPDLMKWIQKGLK